MDSLEFLHSIWEVQGEGFVVVSLRRGPLEWQDLAFKYGRDPIEIPDKGLGDVYFCPNLFERPRRRKGLMRPSRWLYADLDQVDPLGIEAQFGKVLHPSIAWESSPCRYQAMWLLDRALKEDEHQEINRAMTYQLEADKGGWDATQVLRLPGTINHKYSEEPEVKLLWT
jgi:hypothetical protein